MYHHGEGVQQDYHKAMEYYLKAANQGNALAQFHIGIHSFILIINYQYMLFIEQGYCIEMVRELNKITTKRWNFSTKHHKTEMLMPNKNMVFTSP